ncbi:MAG TPA: thioredoxin domain-containing protein [bacterium]|nr:thioredoxin domain-containing protein [bacterium]
MKRALSDYDFTKTVIDGKQTALVVCYTPDSGLCKLVIDLAEELGEKYAATLQVYIMHVLDSKDTFLAHRVINLPTILFFKEGVLMSRLTDIKYSPHLKKQVENLIGGEFLISNPLFTEITDENFDAETRDFPGLVILNFWVSGIDTCWAMESDLNEIARMYKNSVKICVVNWKDSRDLATRYRVADIPTMLFLVKQKEEERAAGLKNFRSIENIVRHVCFRCGLS